VSIHGKNWGGKKTAFKFAREIRLPTRCRKLCEQTQPGLDIREIKLLISFAKERKFIRNIFTLTSHHETAKQHEADSKQSFAYCLLHFDFLHSLLLNLEDGGDEFPETSVDFYRST
jgi:hypothetical protein